MNISGLRRRIDALKEQQGRCAPVDVFVWGEKTEAENDALRRERAKADRIRVDGIRVTCVKWMDGAPGR